MRIARILGYVVAGISLVLIVAIVGGVVALSFVDFNSYKPWVAEEVKKATGRDLAISGEVRVDVSLRPGIVVDDVTLSNAAWGSRPDMVSVRHLAARIALIPLIFGTVEIDRIELDGADILLEVNEQGLANFKFSATDAAPETPAEPDRTGTGIGDLPIVHKAEITEARLTYANAVTGTTFATVIESLTLRGEGPDAPLDLEYTGSVNVAPIRAVAKLGDPAGLFNPVAPWPVEITVEGGGATATISGSITQPLAGREVDLTVSVEGGKTGELSKIIGTDVPELGPYALSGLVAGNMTSTIRASGIKGNLGKSDIEGNVTVTLTGPRPSIDAEFESNNIDVAALLGARAGTGGKDQASPAKNDGRVFPDDPLSLDGLKSVDAAFRYKAASLTGRRGTLSNMAVDATLKDGLLEVSQLRAELYDGAFEGTAQVDSRAEMVGIVANASLRKIDLAPVLAESGAAGTLEGRINFDLDARGKGRSIREIMAGLDGEVTLAMGKGRIRSHALQRWVGGPTQILGNVLKLDASGYSAVNCALGAFDIKQGIATTEGLLLDTDVAAFVGKGTVNLRTEALDLIIDPKVKRTTLSMAVPVKIRGTLMNPQYSLEETAVAKRVGGLLGGFVFPPALFIGLGELGTFGEGECAGSKGSAKSQATPAKPAETTEEEPQRLPGKILKGTGDSITKGLKKLLGD